MIKLLIVDDEEKIRHGIRNIINWEINNIHVIGEAKNGLEALNLINDYSPDILLTDIRMPVMDGLELIEEISTKKFPMKIIIMSGYDDFSYAQKALKLGVSDYLLKPSRAQEILDTVLKVKVELEDENNRKHLYENLKEQFRESLPVLREKYLIRLVKSDNKSIFNINEKLKLLNINLNCSYSTVIVIRIDNPITVREKYNTEDFELMKFAIKNITSETVRKQFNCEVFENNDDIISILKLEDYPDNSTVMEFLKELKNNIEKFIDFSVSIGFGLCYEGSNSIHLSFNEAIKALEVKYLLREAQIISYEDIIDEDMIEISYPINYEREILDCLKNGNSGDVKYYIENFFTALKVDSSSKSSVLKSLLALLFSLYHLCIEMNVETDEAFGHNFSILEDVLKLNNISLIKNKIFDLSKSIILVITNRKSNNKILEQAIKYIKENYSKDLSRAIVAREVYITPGYLSMIFKQELGLNFLDFLHKIRTEKACELLKDGLLKTYEVAFRVGYNDDKYFFQVFKKYTGMTPNQYRNCFKV